MAREASTAATGGLVLQLKAEGHEKGEDTFKGRLPIAKQLEVGRFALEIDSDGAVFAGLAGSVAHGHPSGLRSRKLRRDHGGNALQFQGHLEGLRVLPLKAMECGTVQRYWDTAPGKSWDFRDSNGPTLNQHTRVPIGPAGAFAQKYTVMHNALSDNKLYGHRKVSQCHRVVSDCTLK
jgi:hypothetical protein